MSHIAVLMTSFNRCVTTLKCLEHLFEINNDVEVYLVDDNSTDGTSIIISKNFPKVNVIQSNGNLFWNRGMHLAWEKAAVNDFEYYIWLNDDTLLYDICFDELIECSKLSKDAAIISGIVISNDKTETIYGGTNKKKEL